MRLRVKDWDKFQHYKPKNPNEKPTWIKFYINVLDDFEFHILSVEARALLPMLWLLAAEKNGNLPEINKIAFRLRMSETDVTKSIKQLINNGSIIALDEVYTKSIPDNIENIEDIGKKERGEKTLSPLEENFFETQIWPIYPKTRRGNLKKAKRAYERALTEKRATKEEILNGLDNYRRCDEVERGYAKGAEAWFNADGWANSYKSPRRDDKKQKPSYMDSLVTAAKIACEQIDNELDAGNSRHAGLSDDWPEAGRVSPRLTHLPSRHFEAMASPHEAARFHAEGDNGDDDS